MCMTVSVFCLSTFISMNDRVTHAEITHTPLSGGGDECDADSLSLLIQSYIQTCILLCGCIDILGCLSWVNLTVSLPNSLFLLHTGVLGCTTTSCRPCRPAFLPGFHRFGECVCFSWLFTECCVWVKVLNVCECVYVWGYMTAVWPNMKCLFHMDRTSGLYIQASVHTDVHVQTDRETQWMD
jgi:hypothetical protein